MALKESLLLKKVGASYQITVHSQLTPEVFAAERARTNNLKLPVLIKDVQSVKNPFFVAVVFGSHAKKQATKHSDVDLCIISDNKETTRILSQKTQLFPFQVELHSFTTEQFISMMQSKKPSVAHEIADHGVIVRNTEAYYDLIR